MTTAEGAKKIIAEVSDHDLDQWVRTASFTAEIEEVCVFRTVYGIHVRNLRNLRNLRNFHLTLSVGPWSYSPGAD